MKTKILPLLIVILRCCVSVVDNLTPTIARAVIIPLVLSHTLYHCS